jgi:predicted MPP superfamily phosphohydrolase
VTSESDRPAAADVLDRRALQARLARLARYVARHLARAARWTAEALRTRPARITGRYLAMLAVTLIGMLGGLLLGGRIAADIGPFHGSMAITPSLHGGTDVQVPPLGSLSFNSNDGPLQLTINLGSLDRKQAEHLVTDPNGIDAASQHAITDLRNGVVRLAIQSGLSMIAGALVLNALVWRRWRRVAVAGGMSLVLLAATGGWTAATFRPNSIEEPKYEGLLTMAPAVVGDARSIVNNYGQYSKELQQLVDNVAKVYGTVSNLPVYEPSEGTVRVLHISDMHLNPSAWGVVETVVKQYNIDMVIDTGDIVDWGSTQEDRYIANIKDITVPYVYIRGNHDSESTAAAVKKYGGIVLEDRVRTVDGLTIAGIGDPRFTPDKETNPITVHDPEAQKVLASDQELADTITTYDAAHAHHPVDIAMIHDPGGAGPLAGTVPLVLAGHLHRREVRMLPHDTRLMVEGSTGAAGLRGLQATKPTPMELSVLYFNAEQTLTAYDAITLGGTGRSEITLQRHIINESSATASPSPGTSGSGSPSPTPTR